MSNYNISLTRPWLNFTWNIQREVPRTGYPQPRSLFPGLASPIIWKPSIPGPSSVTKLRLVSTQDYLACRSYKIITFRSKRTNSIMSHRRLVKLFIDHFLSSHIYATSVKYVIYLRTYSVPAIFSISTITKIQNERNTRGFLKINACQEAGFQMSSKLFSIKHQVSPKRGVGKGGISSNFKC